MVPKWDTAKAMRALTRGRGNCSYQQCSGLGISEMIHYMPLEKTRGEATIERLRALAVNAWSLEDPVLRIEREAASIAREMAKLHGGRWRVQIDHLAGLVLVVKQH